MSSPIVEVAIDNYDNKFKTILVEEIAHVRTQFQMSQKSSVIQVPICLIVIPKISGSQT